MSKFFDKDLTKGIVGNIIAAPLLYAIAVMITAITGLLTYLKGLSLHWAILLGVGTAVGITLSANLASLIIVRHRKQGGVLRVERTSLRLQYNAGSYVPLMLSEENIYRWYSFVQIAKFLKPRGKEVTETMSTTLFIVFNTPVAIKQIRIDGGGAKLPLHEVKDYSERHAVLSFLGELQSIVLHIEVI
jgi:hypothetical protein